MEEQLRPQEPPFRLRRFPQRLPPQEKGTQAEKGQLSKLVICINYKLIRAPWQGNRWKRSQTKQGQGHVEAQQAKGRRLRQEVDQAHRVQEVLRQRRSPREGGPQGIRE